MRTQALALVWAAGISGCGSGDHPSPEAPRRCAIARPELSTTRLTTDGPRLVDAAGRVVFLRGVNAGGRSKFAPYAPFDFPVDGYQTALDAYLDRAASWGVDVLRVPFTWAAVEPNEGGDDTEFLARYDALLEGAWKRRMWTIVDFHQDVYSEVYCGDGVPEWAVPAPHPSPHHDCPSWFAKYVSDAEVKSAFDHFWADDTGVRTRFEALWDRMVSRQAGRDGVLGFEIINEPSPGSAKPSDWGPNVVTPFYTATAKRILGAAPGALVLFDATGLDAVLGATHVERPEGDGLVFAPHSYDPSVFFGGVPAASAIEGQIGGWAKYGATWSVPVLLGEFGVSHERDDAEELVRMHYDALDAKSLSGTYWEYSVAEEEWNGETLGLVRADGTEYPVAAAIVRPYPRAVAGAEIEFAYDAGTGDFTLSYTPAAGGVTEVVLPERIYDSGGRVEINGACVDDTDVGELRILSEAGVARVELRVRR